MLFPANDNAPLPRRQRQPSKDDVALAKALLQLGQIATHLRDQARATDFAGLPVEDAPAYDEIRHQIAEIKSLLVKGLGVRER